MLATALGCDQHNADYTGEQIHKMQAVSSRGAVVELPEIVKVRGGK